MPDPIMQSPLHAFDLAAQAKPISDQNGVWASEVPFLGYINLRGQATDAAFADATTTALGVSLPTQPCSLANPGDLKFLWLGPDEWMIICARHRLADVLSRLSQGLENVRSQVVDNSGGYTQLVLRGRNALDVMKHTSAYNFAALAPGRVVGTTFGKASIYAHREGEGFCLLVRRSFADYIWRYLVRAATPYRLGIAVLDEPMRPDRKVAS